MSTLPMDEVIIKSWDDLGLPQEGPAKITFDKAEVREYHSANGPFEKASFHVTVEERPNGDAIGETFQTSLPVDNRYMDNLRNLVNALGIPARDVTTRQDLHELVKAIEGLSIWTTIVNKAGRDGKKRPLIGFRYAQTLEELLS